MDDLKIRITALTNVGLVRKNNEDNFIVCRDLTNGIWEFSQQFTKLGIKGAVFAVADGMGGQNAGEIASDMAVKTIKSQFSNIKDDIFDDSVHVKQFMYDTIKIANDNINDYANKNPESVGMGTTLVLAWVLKQNLYVAWCGDSRAYIYDENGLHQITRDHSYVQDLVDKGIITSEQAFYHPDKNIITRCLGNDNSASRPDIISIPIENNIKILLCSDGLNSMIEDYNIGIILQNYNNIDIARERLVDEALKAGGDDNITVILCDIDTGKKSSLGMINTTKKNKRRSWIRYGLAFLLLFVIFVFLLKYYK